MIMTIIVNSTIQTTIIVIIVIQPTILVIFRRDKISQAIPGAPAAAAIPRGSALGCGAACRSSEVPLGFRA